MKRSPSFPVWLVAAVLVALLGWAMAGHTAALAQPAPAATPAASGSVDPAATPAPEGVAAPVQSREMSFLQLLMTGGWFMVPIGLCSLMGVAIIVERMVALRRSQIVPPTFMLGLKKVFRTPADQDRALTYCREDASPIARVMAVGIRKISQGEEAVEQAIEDAGANEVSKLRRNLRMLYGVSAVAPMLGLLGTIWGMIEAFQVVEVTGGGKAGPLAKGIYVALVTTLAGLMVAIPVLVFYYYFLGRIDRIVSDMNDTSEEFIEHIVHARQAAAAPGSSVSETLPQGTPATAG